MEAPILKKTTKKVTIRCLILKRNLKFKAIKCFKITSVEK